jgi:hypothetical protein
MAENDSTIPTARSPLTVTERRALAQRLYQEFYTRCFWHCPRDLVITDALIPLVVEGLRKHGGRQGFILSGRLRRDATPNAPADTADMAGTPRRRDS